MVRVHSSELRIYSQADNASIASAVGEGAGAGAAAATDGAGAPASMSPSAAHVDRLWAWWRDHLLGEPRLQQVVLLRRRLLLLH